MNYFNAYNCWYNWASRPVLWCFNATTEKHSDSRNASIQIDTEDVKKLYDWFVSQDPFPVAEAVISINAGIVGDENIIYHEADEIVNIICIVYEFRVLKNKIYNIG